MDIMSVQCHRCSGSFYLPAPQKGKIIVAKCPHCHLGWLVVDYGYNYAMSDYDIATVSNVLSGMSIEDAFNEAGVPDDYRAGARYRLMEYGSANKIKQSVLEVMRKLFPTI
jgi:hypothetical protein